MPCYIPGSCDAAEGSRSRESAKKLELLNEETGGWRNDSDSSEESVTKRKKPDNHGRHGAFGKSVMPMSIDFDGYYHYYCYYYCFIFTFDL